MGTCPKPHHVSTEGSQQGVYFTSDTLTVHFVAAVYFNGAGIRCCAISWGGKCKYFVTVLKWIFQGSVLECLFFWRLFAFTPLLLLLLLLTLESTCKKTYMLLEVALFCCLWLINKRIFFMKKKLTFNFQYLSDLVFSYLYLSNGILRLVRVFLDTVLLL